MKSRKCARPLPQPEECGVWLDASQLKRKSHQAVIPCTSSRFNPLSRRQSTDSVLIAFTQTKSPQLCTKQTSMYSFFSPAGNRNKPSSITEIKTFAYETSLEFDAEEAQNMIQSSLIGASTCLPKTYNDCEPVENQESLSSYKIHRNIGRPVPSGGNDCDDQSCALDKPGNTVGCLSNASIIRSQKTSLDPPMNFWATGFGSMSHNNPSDSSVSKCPLQDCNKDWFAPSQFESQLFTQDTQGNRVICHRSTSDRRMNAPLQDKTNVAWDTRSPKKGPPQTLCDEDPLHKMFTQDSEGHLVIKH